MFSILRKLLGRRKDDLVDVAEHIGRAIVSIDRQFASNVELLKLNSITKTPGSKPLNDRPSRPWQVTYSLFHRVRYIALSAELSEEEMSRFLDAVFEATFEEHFNVVPAGHPERADLREFYTNDYSAWSDELLENRRTDVEHLAHTLKEDLLENPTEEFLAGVQDLVDALNEDRALLWDVMAYLKQRAR